MENKEMIQELNLPLYQAKGWMKLLGVLSFIYGVLSIFTIVGIIFCWLPIWVGILLFKAGSEAELAQSTGDKVHFVEALNKIKTTITIYGVLALIGLIVGGLSLLIAGGSIFSALSAFK